SFYAEFSNLRISVLRGTMAIPFHGTADFAVLEDSKTGTHDVLMVERGKANLRFRGGILAFQSSGQSPTNEITELFTSWETSIKPHKEKHGRHWYAL
uniref:hypothetical protein n=1 Tax=Klebsiella pneumoniae TaxID=573 RepID=UPI00345A7BE3